MRLVLNGQLGVVQFQLRHLVSSIAIYLIYITYPNSDQTDDSVARQIPDPKAECLIHAFLRKILGSPCIMYVVTRATAILFFLDKIKICATEECPFLLPFRSK